MKIYPREPDLSTIYGRICRDEIDLQPDFQRDLVWNKAKKQGLIDTILRNWQFPPVFMVVPISGDRLDVLDGQQRLNAIYEFYKNEFQVDGNIQPLDAEISRLNGLTYSDLPKNIKSKFDRYSIRVFELEDYKEDEPYELFFRLNQGSSLTPAEKRNTLYGPVRDSVRKLVVRMAQVGLDNGRIGFNNNRLSYHDVMARFLYAIQYRSINKKITDSLLIEYFRSGVDVDAGAFEIASESLDILSRNISNKVRLNKATLFSWLIFFSLELESIGKNQVVEIFEQLRQKFRDSSLKEEIYTSFLLNIYHEKASVSVNDAVPVQLRLLIIYMVLFEINLLKPITEASRKAESIIKEFKFGDIYSEERLVSVMFAHRWGDL